MGVRVTAELVLCWCVVVLVCVWLCCCAGPGQGARTAFEDAHTLTVALQECWPDRQAVAKQYEVSDWRWCTIWTQPE